ncbi:MAG: hypothetical protein ACLPUO_26495 [Streptosporangiaceae bacterium]
MGEMAIRLTVEVDEERLRGAGHRADDAAIMAQLDTLKDGRLACRPATPGCPSGC